MSLLMPLYGLGLLAVSLPVIFHLIRRMPRGEVPFSSLMFLSPSPPRLTRRSRLDNILLLVLRGAALSLLAFAFARPFLRQQLPAEPTDADSQRVAIVVDTSASMRRGDLWQQAVAAVDKVVAACGPLDQLGLYACDTALRPLAGFEELAQLPPAERRAVLAARLQSTAPTWAGTELGRGLTDAVEALGQQPETVPPGSRIARRVVLVSDMQQGSRLGVLADFPWPEDIRLELRPVRPVQPTNAGLHLADQQTADSPAGAAEVRVRVANDAESAVDQFQLLWVDAEERPVGEPVTAYVPAGESRIVRVRRPDDSSATQRLQLSGDDCPFDNTLYVTAEAQSELSVLYLGTDRADDPQGLRYYFERALSEGVSRPVTVTAPAGDEPLTIESPTKVPLVVVTTEPGSEHIEPLRKYAESGGTLLFVLAGGAPPTTWADVLHLHKPAIDEVSADGFTLLSQIAFDHPLFAPMAGPNFNDFTPIRFWRHRRLPAEAIGGGRVLARFEGSDPAVVEWLLGKGHVYLLASGWQPADSQLARSWKFVLLVSALVDGGRGGNVERTAFLVNEPVPLGDRNEAAQPLVVTRPDGSTVSLAADARAFVATDAPGVYSLESGEGPQHWAVNLDPQESRTAGVGMESLEQLGCRLVGASPVAQNGAQRAQLHDARLEGRQKYWQWLLMAALGVVVAETWLAGHATRPAAAEGA